MTRYSRRNVQNFQQELPTALSQTQKILPAIFTSFHKSKKFQEKSVVFEIMHLEVLAGNSAHIVGNNLSSVANVLTKRS